ncbi:hypothetical protein P280DRAFT_516384 [Massarina eburnea CBS 473.64]|uniref:Uncharacterized protein n=1 Tax=Massarina eburnea CBS 473.64 TaxID=1395130 RepID=A0A6A6S6F8_9PLEO|nr:hypothetical protein P280DRAFT_516384 [Massarina eburnea CBS 473.64]
MKFFTIPPILLMASVTFVTGAPFHPPNSTAAYWPPNKGCHKIIANLPNVTLTQRFLNDSDIIAAMVNNTKKGSLPNFLSAIANFTNAQAKAFAPRANLTARLMPLTKAETEEELCISEFMQMVKRSVAKDSVNINVRAKGKWETNSSSGPDTPSDTDTNSKTDSDVDQRKKSGVFLYSKRSHGRIVAPPTEEIVTPPVEENWPSDMSTTEEEASDTDSSEGEDLASKVVRSQRLGVIEYSETDSSSGEDEEYLASKVVRSQRLGVIELDTVSETDTSDEDEEYFAFKTVRSRKSGAGSFSKRGDEEIVTPPSAEASESDSDSSLDGEVEKEEEKDQLYWTDKEGQPGDWTKFVESEPMETQPSPTRITNYNPPRAASPEAETQDDTRFSGRLPKGTTVHTNPDGTVEITSTPKVIASLKAYMKAHGVEGMVLTVA